MDRACDDGPCTGEETEMSDRADVLVIGGGVIGACVAAAVAERGAAVTLLEREPEVCPPESAVYANCGLLVPSEVEPLAHPGALGQGLRWMLDGTSPFYVKPRASLALARWLWLVPRRLRAAGGAGARAAPARAQRRQCHAARRARRRRRRRRGSTGATAGSSSGRRAPGLDAAVEEAAALRSLGVASDVLTAAEVRDRVPQVRAGQRRRRDPHPRRRPHGPGGLHARDGRRAPSAPARRS